MLGLAVILGFLLAAIDDYAQISHCSFFIYTLITTFKADLTVIVGRVGAKGVKKFEKL